MIPLEIMRAAAALGARAPHSNTALSVGCIITDNTGAVLATAFSREDGNPASHAEKIALEKLPPGTDAATLHLFCTVEPCGTRLSGNPSCTSLILKHGIRHVYYAMHEPAHFVHQDGLQQLQTQGITLTKICDDAIFEMVSNANSHINWQ